MPWGKPNAPMEHDRGHGGGRDSGDCIPMPGTTPQPIHHCIIAQAPMPMFSSKSSPTCPNVPSQAPVIEKWMDFFWELVVSTEASETSWMENLLINNVVDLSSNEECFSGLLMVKGSCPGQHQASEICNIHTSLCVLPRSQEEEGKSNHSAGQPEYTA